MNTIRDERHADRVRAEDAGAMGKNWLPPAEDEGRQSDTQDSDLNEYGLPPGATVLNTSHLPAYKYGIRFRDDDTGCFVFKEYAKAQEVREILKDIRPEMPTEVVRIFSAQEWDNASIHDKFIFDDGTAWILDRDNDVELICVIVCDGDQFLKEDAVCWQENEGYPLAAHIVSEGYIQQIAEGSTHRVAAGRIIGQYRKGDILRLFPEHYDPKMSVRRAVWCQKHEEAERQSSPPTTDPASWLNIFLNTQIKEAPTGETDALQDPIHDQIMALYHRVNEELHPQIMQHYEALNELNDERDRILALIRDLRKLHREEINPSEGKCSRIPTAETDAPHLPEEVTGRDASLFTSEEVADA